MSPKKYKLLFAGGYNESEIGWQHRVLSGLFCDNVRNDVDGDDEEKMKYELP